MEPLRTAEKTSTCPAAWARAWALLCHQPLSLRICQVGRAPSCCPLHSEGVDGPWVGEGFPWGLPSSVPQTSTNQLITATKQSPCLRLSTYTKPTCLFAAHLTI